MLNLRGSEDSHRQMERQSRSQWESRLGSRLAQHCRQLGLCSLSKKGPLKDSEEGDSKSKAWRERFQSRRPDYRNRKQTWKSAGYRGNMH